MNKILKNFIAIEGINGSGKSTLIKRLHEIIVERPNITNQYFLTKEPTNNIIGKLIKELLMIEKNIQSETFAYLFTADRNEHLFAANGILKALKNGKTVITDRYLFSSLVYQDEIGEMLNNDFPMPERVIYIDIPWYVAYDRMKKLDKIDIMEQNLTFKDILKKYDRIWEKYSKTIDIIRLKDDFMLLSDERILELFSF